MDYAAIVLAGGAARRMGGAIKPLLTVGGITLLDRVLSAVSDAHPIVVVGPSEVDGGRPVIRVREEPPGGGPVAAIAAGMTACAEAQWIAVLAGDLPFVTHDALVRLWVQSKAGHPPRLHPRVQSKAGRFPRLRRWVQSKVPRRPLSRLWVQSKSVALYVDGDGRRQPLVSMWRADALRAALAQKPPAGRPMRDLLPAEVTEVRWPKSGPPPWYDCDTPEALREAQTWL